MYSAEFCFLTDWVALTGSKKTSGGFGDNEKHRHGTHEPSELSFSLFLRASGKSPWFWAPLSWHQAADLIGFPVWGWAAQASRGFHPEPKPQALGLVCNPPIWLEPPALWIYPRFHTGARWWQLQVPDRMESVCSLHALGCLIQASPRSPLPHWELLVVHTRPSICQSADDCWCPQAHFCGHCWFLLTRT